MHRAREVSQGTFRLNVAYEGIDGRIDDDDGAMFKVLGLVERFGCCLDRVRDEANLGRADG